MNKQNLFGQASTSTICWLQEHIMDRDAHTAYEQGIS